LLEKGLVRLRVLIRVEIACNDDGQRFFAVFDPGFDDLRRAFNGDGLIIKMSVQECESPASR